MNTGCGGQDTKALPDEYQGNEYEAAFAIAKAALGLVAKFRTPPTPEVYEVWYRFVEGEDKTLRDKVTFLIDELGSANRKQINAVRDQFFPSRPAAEVDREVHELITSMSSIQSIIRGQSEAGEAFDSSIQQTNERLVNGDPSPENLRVCIMEILESNAKMQSELTQMKTRLEDSQHQICQLRENLNDSQRNMMLDPLTQIGNRRFFDSMIQQSLAHPDRNTKELFLILIDLDSFKQINDQFGHDIGDAVVKYIAERIQDVANTSAVSRYGGDEFAVFFNATTVEEGKRLARDLSEAIFRTNLKLSNSDTELGRISVSIGAAALKPSDNGETWFQAADQMLYAAKSRGRNGVMCR